jgi:hypothetical protein
MRKLWENIQTNQDWIARTIKLKAEEIDTNAQSDESETMSMADIAIE